MRLSIVAIILTACVAFCGCDETEPPRQPPQATEGDWTFIQLTDNEFWDGEFDTDGHSVVWVGKEQLDESPDIYLYDGETTRALTTDGQDNSRPLVHGDYVVWASVGLFQDVDGPVRKKNFLQFYNGETVRQIPDSAGVMTYSLSGHYVTWNARIGEGKVGIFLYDGMQTQLIAETECTNNYPDLSGTTVVWRGCEAGLWHVYLFDGDDVRTVSNSDGRICYLPTTNGRNVAWSAAYPDKPAEIFFYDGRSARQLTRNDSPDEHPRLEGQQVVWQRYDGNDYEIFLFDGQTVIQLTNNQYNDTDPSISGERVVWMGNLTNNSSNCQVFVYNGRSITQLTETEAHNSTPMICGSRIVFGRDDGNDKEIVMAIRREEG
ncbi:MAG: hypothetical protein ACYTFO_01300 [Planctomycetota bacterium]|jgi:hypothetical protein